MEVKFDPLLYQGDYQPLLFYLLKKGLLAINHWAGGQRSPRVSLEVVMTRKVLPAGNVTPVIHIIVTSLTYPGLSKIRKTERNSLELLKRKFLICT
jgi:hypothetical protein